MPNLVNREQAREDLDKLYGNGRYINDMSNICYRDAYFARDLEIKYGMSPKELKKRIDYKG